MSKKNHALQEETFREHWMFQREHAWATPPVGKHVPPAEENVHPAEIHKTKSPKPPRSPKSRVPNKDTYGKPMP